LNKVIEEKSKGLKEERQQNDNNAEENKQQEQQHLSLSAEAYKLFSDRKTPLEVAIILNLKESEVTEFYKEYWKLKQLHDLMIVYEETKGDIDPFLKLYRLSKAAGMSALHVTNLLKIANTNLSDIQRRYERLKREVNKLPFHFNPACLYVHIQCWSLFLHQASDYLDQS
jgi:hypothetical protein